MHPSTEYLGRLSASSKKTMRRCLQLIAEALGHPHARKVPWHALTPDQIRRVRSDLGSRFSAATVNKCMSAIRGVLRETAKAGLLGHAEAEQICDSVQWMSTAEPGQAKGRSATDKELRRLFQVCAADESLLGRRDAAMLALLFGAGLKRTEVVSLDVGDVADGKVEVREGGTPRTVPFDEGAQDAVDRWLLERGLHEGPLLCHVSGDKVAPTRRLSDQTTHYMMRRRCEQAGIEYLPPGDLRRTFLEKLLNQGVAIDTVRDLAGHAHALTTARYGNGKGNWIIPRVPYKEPKVPYQQPETDKDLEAAELA